MATEPPVKPGVLPAYNTYKKRLSYNQNNITEEHKEHALLLNKDEISVIIAD